MSESAGGRGVYQQTTGDWQWTLSRLGVGAGLLSIIVTTVGFALHGDLPMGKNGTEIIQWATGVDQMRFACGIYVEVLGYLLVLVFAAWLWSVVGRPEHASTWLSMAGLTAATLFIGTSALNDARPTQRPCSAPERVDAPLGGRQGRDDLTLHL